MLNRRTGESLGHEFGAGEGRIWLDNLECLGSENDLAHCRRNNFADHNCGHSEDVSISCSGGKDNTSVCLCLPLVA